MSSTSLHSPTTIKNLVISKTSTVRIDYQCTKINKKDLPTLLAFNVRGLEEGNEPYNVGEGCGKITEKIYLYYLCDPFSNFIVES